MKVKQQLRNPLDIVVSKLVSICMRISYKYIAIDLLGKCEINRKVFLHALAFDYHLLY